MGDAFFWHVEGALQIEDRPTVLDRHHAPRKKRPPIPNPVHLVEDRGCRVAGTEEVAVQGVHLTAVDRAPGGHESLSGDLPTEDA